MSANPYELLANAIVVQAAVDYRNYPALQKQYAARLSEADKKLKSALLTNDKRLIDNAKKGKGRIKHEASALEKEQKYLERFFDSAWFHLLTKANGESILRQLQMEIQNCG